MGKRMRNKKLIYNNEIEINEETKKKHLHEFA
jgi:hypothetical protein